MPPHRSSFRPRLESESPISAHIQAVTAPGGVGKTKLARHYADRYLRLYQRIFCVDCRAGVEAGFASIHDKVRDGSEFAALPNDV